jgi:curved DNA-binding protein CbpA
MPDTNYYCILGIDINASDSDIKKAFRNLAKKFHPDKNPGDEQTAEQKFKQIISAYQVLIDRDKRHKYDLTLKKLYKEAELKRRSRFTKKTQNDEKTLCQMILVELLRPDKQKALQLYESLVEKISNFRLDKYMSDADTRDCEFLLAEAYHQMGRLSQAEFLYSRLLEKEKKKAYFYHFAQEIRVLLKSIYVQNINKSEKSTDVLSNLQKILAMKFSAYETAWVYKKAAEAYYRLNNIENAINSLKCAFEINPELPGAKKISRKLGFNDD